MRTKAEISYALARAERQVTDLAAALEQIAALSGKSLHAQASSYIEAKKLATAALAKAAA